MGEPAPITEPRQLGLDDDMIELIVEYLTPAGERQFRAELLRALMRAQHNNNLRHVSDVITAWHRTLLVHYRGEGDPRDDFDDVLRDETPQTWEHLRDRFAAAR